ncbi:hypothetical protein QF004_001676 [Chryseobacterium sp. MDT2-18]|nr:hypothetical protein [Chryseobacterium sp. MDT2-18]
MKLLQIILIFIFTFSFAQKGFKILHQKKTVIPFKLINNLIFIPININGVDLTFLLDSGVNETILFSLDKKEVNFKDVEKIKFSGLGESMDIEGLKSENNTVSIGKDYKDAKHTVFIILDEGINFSSHVGIPVNGIIGYQFFKDHPVEINFTSKKITVFNDENSLIKRQKRFTEFPITIENNKPYIMVDVEMTDKKVQSKMLIDLGNSDAIWLFPKLIENFEYNRPNIDDYLGRGFNGDIFGKRSRIHNLYLGKFNFAEPLTAMPDEYSIQNLKLVPGRKGSVGNDILRRFTVIFDYQGQRILLKRNKNYNDPFLFNSSGLDIQQNGMTWEKDLVEVETKKNIKAADGIEVIDQTQKFQYNFVLKPKFSVAGCRKDSPCFVAGIRKNDQLISIDKKPVNNMTMEKINNYFKEGNGKKIDLKIERGNQVLNFTITLEDPIPYQK